MEISKGRTEMLPRKELRNRESRLRKGGERMLKTSPASFQCVQTGCKWKEYGGEEEGEDLKPIFKSEYAKEIKNTVQVQYHHGRGSNSVVCHHFVVLPERLNP